MVLKAARIGLRLVCRRFEMTHRNYEMYFGEKRWLPDLVKPKRDKRSRQKKTALQLAKEGRARSAMWVQKEEETKRNRDTLGIFRL